jgi:hypothetical protein
MLEYDNNYIRRLIQLNLVGGLSPEEKGKLENWIDESEEHRLLFYKIKKQLFTDRCRRCLEKSEGKDVRSSRCPSAQGTEVVEICRSGDTGFIITEFVVCLERENGK